MVYQKSTYQVVAKPGQERLVSETLNRLCREQLKLKLLADIRADMEVCELEGYDKLEYINELIEMLTALKNKTKG